MDYNNVKELIGMIDSSSLTDFEYKQGDFFVKMSKNSADKSCVKSQGQAVTNSFDTSSNSVLSNESTVIAEEISKPITIMPQNKVEVKEGSIVKAPIVGTFYQSSSPEKPPLVKVGDKVKEGDLLCIIEAMKIMNEIKSPYTGEVAEIFVSNEDMVEYNQPLFRIV